MSDIPSSAIRFEPRSLSDGKKSHLASGEKKSLPPTKPGNVFVLKYTIMNHFKSFDRHRCLIFLLLLLDSSQGGLSDGKKSHLAPGEKKSLPPTKHGNVFVLE